MRLTITRGDPDLGRVESAVSDYLDGLPITPDLHHQVLVSVFEAVANAVEHGQRDGGRGPVLLAIDVVAGQITATVADDGPGFDPDACPDPRTPERLLLPGGRGVFLMHHLMDSVDFTFPPGGGTEVTLRKALSPPGDGSGDPSEGAPRTVVPMRRTGDVTILEVDGTTLVGAGSVELRRAVSTALDKGAGKIVLNLGRVVAIDSSGIGGLAGAHATASNRGAKLALSDVRHQVRDILLAAELLTAFNVYDSESEAVASL